MNRRRSKTHSKFGYQNPCSEYSKIQNLDKKNFADPKLFSIKMIPKVLGIWNIMENFQHIQRVSTVYA